MKKLIAARPIQYMGRTYESGDTVPAYDGKMVEAWLAAGSVTWVGADAAEPEAKPAANPDELAADALRAMGLCVTDDAGNFVGAENLEEQIRNMVITSEGNGQDGTQGDGNGQDRQETGGQNDTQNDLEASGGTETVTGHLDAEELEKTMTRDQLDKLATDMGLDITKCKNKTDVASLIAAAPVQAPKDENGSAR